MAPNLGPLIVRSLPPHLAQQHTGVVRHHSLERSVRYHARHTCWQPRLVHLRATSDHALYDESLCNHARHPGSRASFTCLEIGPHIMQPMLVQPRPVRTRAAPPRLPHALSMGNTVGALGAAFATIRMASTRMHTHTHVRMHARTHHGMDVSLQVAAPLQQQLPSVVIHAV